MRPPILETDRSELKMRNYSKKKNIKNSQMRNKRNSKRDPEQKKDPHVPKKNRSRQVRNAWGTQWDSTRNPGDSWRFQETQETQTTHFGELKQELRRHLPSDRDGQRWQS